VQMVRIDKNSWLPADETCPEDYYVAFLDGTVPNSTCSHMGDSTQSVLQGIFSNSTQQQNPAPPAPANPQNPGATEPSPPKKKNIFQKIFGGGSKPDSNPDQNPQ
jgi:penicillin-binding protein 1B